MFDKSYLPYVEKCTSGYMLPKASGTVATCVAPVPVKIPYPANWGKPDGATMDVPAGGWITCLGKEDICYNAEFRSEYSLTGRVLYPDEDDRAREIDEFWRSLGFVVLIVESRKTVGVEVIGIIDKDMIGKDFMTREGVEKLHEGDAIVRSPRSGDVWRITPKNRAKRYAENGRIIPGSLPAEYC